MAMTKAERERMAALEHELRLAKALRWPTEAPTLVEPPNNGAPIGVFARGFWWHVRGDRYRVEYGISSSNSHAVSYVKEDIDSAVAGPHGAARVSWSQGACVLAATRRAALLAIRQEATKQAAELLARIDADIEKEGK